MKKYLKVALVVFCVAILSASMLLVTACGTKVKAESYGAAVAAWKDAKNKVATDDIEISVALPTGLAKDLKLTAKGQLVRTYENDEIVRVDGKITYVSIEGLKKLWEALGSVISILPIGDDIKSGIEDLIGNGTITMDGSEVGGAIAQGYIRKEGDKYYLSGGVSVEKWFGDFTETYLDLEANEEISVGTTTVDNVIAMFIDKNAYFDSISLYDVDQADVTVKDKTTLAASFDGKKAMKWLVQDILYKTLDEVIKGEKNEELEQKLNEYEVDENKIGKVMSTFDKVLGYVNQFFTEVLGAEDTEKAIETFIKLDGNTEAEITFDKKNIKAFAFEQKATATLKSEQFYEFLEFAFGIVDELVEKDLPAIVDTVKGMVPGFIFKGDYENQITASIDVKVNTALEIK